MSTWGTVYSLERDRAIGNDPASLRAEIERLKASELAWKIIAKQNDQWNALPQSEKEAALDKALTDTIEECEQVKSVLERARTILGNMAQENEGAIFNRWPISHEPLRTDARGLLPEIDRVLGTAYQQQAGGGDAG